MLRTIDEIEKYIRLNFYSPSAAKKFQKNIFSAIMRIQMYPRIGKAISNDSKRILIYKKYLIFYEIQEKEKLIIIKSLIHSMQNLR